MALLSIKIILCNKTTILGIVKIDKFCLKSIFYSLKTTANVFDIQVFNFILSITYKTTTKKCKLIVKSKKMFAIKHNI